MFSGRVGSHGVAWRHCRLTSHTPLHGPWLSLPPSISLSLWFCPPGHPELPFPVPIQMLADAKWYLQPPKASAGDVKGVAQIGPGACGWWAQGEPGWARVKYGQVCSERAGTARFYNIQVFPLPALSLAVKTELDHKHSNLKEEKRKRKQEQ